MGWLMPTLLTSRVFFEFFRNLLKDLGGHLSVRGL
jgi:hypothetical protein